MTRCCEPLPTCASCEDTCWDVKLPAPMFCQRAMFLLDDWIATRGWVYAHIERERAFYDDPGMIDSVSRPS